MERKTVGIVLFDDIEVLDFCGPFEVFTVARLNENRRREEPSPFEVMLVAERPGPITATGGMTVLPHYTFENCRSLDWMRESFPSVGVEYGKHFVEDGRVFTSAGISAGIDMSLKVVERCLGEGIARATARHMEYPYPRSDARRIQS